MAIRSIDPCTGEVLATYPPASENEIERCLYQAARAGRQWSSLPIAERAKVLRALADALESRLERHAETITEEMGKPISQARQEVEKCVWTCRYFAEHGERLLAAERVPLERGAKGSIRFEPLGPLFAIMPWNFPYWQVFRFAVPAALAGNSIVLKHAPNVPRCALAIEREWANAGGPRWLLQSLFIEEDQAERVIADPRIAGVTLTGSEEAGRAVAAAAGRSLKKTVLELGGSDAFIVLADAPVEEVAEIAARARTINSGQSCIAAKRLIVERPIYKRFLDALVEAMQKLKVGNLFEPDTMIGPLARDDLRDHLHRQVQESVAAGAQVVIGGEPLPGPGFFYPPTILVRLKRGMPAYEEELFGPVAAVLPANDPEQALALANDTRFGLAASVWTRDAEVAEWLAARLQVGVVHINSVVRSDPRLPFGGIKRSGYGRELGSYGIKEFVNIKAVVEEKLPSRRAVTVQRRAS